MGLEIFERGELPRWAPVRQRLDATDVGDVAAAVAAEFARPEVGGRLGPGQRVALTAGSRGIDKIDQVLRAAVGRRWGVGLPPRRLTGGPDGGTMA